MSQENVIDLNSVLSALMAGRRPESKEKIEPSTLGQVMGLLLNYDAAMEGARPFIGLASQFSGKVAGDLGPAISIIFKLVNDVAETSEMVKESDRLNQRRAVRRMAAIKAYMDAGLTRQEAVSFIIADISKSDAYWEKAQTTATSRGARTAANRGSKPS